MKEHTELEMNGIVQEVIISLIKNGRLRIAMDLYNEKIYLKMDGEAPYYENEDAASVFCKDIVANGTPDQDRGEGYHD